MYDNTCGKLMYVHGTVVRDMVLGVNDISQIADPSLFDNYDDEYINELIKQKTNELNEENTDKKVFDLLKSSDLIYIYGMSIGETDKLWWDRICTLMAQKSNLHVIIHRYDAPEDGLIRRNFRLFVNQAKKEFTSHSHLEIEKKKAIEARIHIDRTNIFRDLDGLVDNPSNRNTDDDISKTAGSAVTKGSVESTELILHFTYYCQFLFKISLFKYSVFFPELLIGCSFPVLVRYSIFCLLQFRISAASATFTTR